MISTIVPVENRSFIKKRPLKIASNYSVKTKPEDEPSNDLNSVGSPQEELKQMVDVYCSNELVSKQRQEERVEALKSLMKRSKKV